MVSRRTHTWTHTHTCTHLTLTHPLTTPICSTVTYRSKSQVRLSHTGSFRDCWALMEPFYFSGTFVNSFRSTIVIRARLTRFLKCKSIKTLHRMTNLSFFLKKKRQAKIRHSNGAHHFPSYPRQRGPPTNKASSSVLPYLSRYQLLGGYMSWVGPGCINKGRLSLYGTIL